MWLVCAQGVIENARVKDLIEGYRLDVHFLRGRDPRDIVWALLRYK